jgi:spore maturation protein CgeB
MKILIVGLCNGTHIGNAFFNAAKLAYLNPRFIDSELAYKSPKWLKQINWHLRGKYPSQLGRFSKKIVQECYNFQPELILASGIAPINPQALIHIGKRGIKRINFLTDDPWNPSHYAPWFLKALPYYDIIFSPRRSNIDDIIQAGCHNVQYLPFGYDPELFYSPIEPSKQLTNSGEQSQYIGDVVFAGGADQERVAYISALIRSGIKVNLYGAYWERYPETKTHTRGIADTQTLRFAIKGAKISLCLVRKANRDGHCMRTFEVPAVGACMLTEDTQEHREIFGEEGKAVVYFKTISEMVEKARWLLNNDIERQRLAQNAHLLITQGQHTYKNRLETILSLI